MNKIKIIFMLLILPLLLCSCGEVEIFDDWESKHEGDLHIISDERLSYGADYYENIDIMTVVTIDSYDDENIVSNCVLVSDEKTKLIFSFENKDEIKNVEKGKKACILGTVSNESTYRTLSASTAKIGETVKISNCHLVAYDDVKEYIDRINEKNKAETKWAKKQRKKREKEEYEKTLNDFIKKQNKKEEKKKKKKNSESKYKKDCKTMWYRDIFFSSSNLNGQKVKLKLYVEDRKYFSNDDLYDSTIVEFINEYDLDRTFITCGVKRKEGNSYVGENINVFFNSKSEKKAKSFSPGDTITAYGEIIDYSTNTWSGYNSCSILLKYVD